MAERLSQSKAMAAGHVSPVTRFSRGQRHPPLSDSIEVEVALAR